MCLWILRYDFFTFSPAPHPHFHFHPRCTRTRTLPALAPTQILCILIWTIKKPSHHWVPLHWRQYFFLFSTSLQAESAKLQSDSLAAGPGLIKCCPSVTWTFQPPQIRNPCCCWRILIISRRLHPSALLPWSVLNFQLLCVDNWWPSAKKFLKTFNGPVYVFKVEIIPLYVIALLN